MPKAKSGSCCSGRLWFSLCISATYSRSTYPASFMDLIQVLMSCGEVTLTVANMWLSETRYELSIIPLCQNKSRSLGWERHHKNTAVVNSLWRHKYEETGFFFSPVCTDYFAVIVPIGAWFKSKRREYIMLGHAVGFSICGLIKAEL